MAVIKIVPMPGAVGDKGDEGAPGAQGPQGETGLQGPAGADALWHYNGPWQSNSTYAEGDVVTYEGQTYYATGITILATTPDMDSNFDLIAAKGQDGTSADIADFIFTLSGSGSYNTNSSIKIVDHDMRLITEKSDPSVVDADIMIQSADNVTITSEAHITLFGSTGTFLGNSSIPENQIATIGDIETSVNDALPDEESFVVNGGTLDVQPTFTGAPLFTGSYVKHGPMVFFQVQVDMDNITSFGTGQYFIDLPFTAKYGQQFKEGCLHDISSGKQYAIGGHVYAGESRMSLTFTNSAGQDEAFDHNSPVVLSTADNFHISGTFISA